MKPNFFQFYLNLNLKYSLKHEQMYPNKHDLAQNVI